MDANVLSWIKSQIGQWFASPRTQVFRGNPQDFKIERLDEASEKVHIRFHDSKYPALPLVFWMFDRALKHLKDNAPNPVPLGSALQPPYMPNSVENAIWTEPYPTGKSTYKVSTHICDILALAGLVEYTEAKNPQTGRKVQGARMKSSSLPIEARPSTSPTKTEEEPTEKEAFLRKYGSLIKSWVDAHEYELVEARLNYTWKGKTVLECVDERNKVSKKVIMSRIKNSGGVDLPTLDEVMRWGEFGKFPLRDEAKALLVTRQAFMFLDVGDVVSAVLALLSVHRVGISRATKVLSLFDQESYGIYDSRVGNALRDLTCDGERLIHIPPGRVSDRSSDVGVSDLQWAEDYKRLLWIIAEMRRILNQRGHTYRVADVEMALFVLGK